MVKKMSFEETLKGLVGKDFTGIFYLPTKKVINHLKI
jgi:hypothetical protein